MHQASLPAHHLSANSKSTSRSGFDPIQGQFFNLIGGIGGWRIGVEVHQLYFQVHARKFQVHQLYFPRWEIGWTLIQSKGG